MEIVYQPDGKESRTWQFAPRKLMSVEAEAIESVGGSLWEDFDTFGRLFNKGNRRAFRAALWILLRREDSTLRFESLSVGVMDIIIRLGEDEIDTIRELLRTVPDMDPEQREYFVDILGEDPVIIDPKDPLPNDSQQSPIPSDLGESVTAG